MPQFPPAERATIEANILTALRAIYDGYELTFVTQQPTDEHDVVYMARDNNHPSVSSTNLGSVPVDMPDQVTYRYTTTNGPPPTWRR